MVMLSAVRHFVRIILFTASTLPPGSSTEHMFCYGDRMKTATAKLKVGGITQNIEREHACFQEKYSKVCITRPAVNENLCGDSHTEHV